MIRIQLDARVPVLQCSLAVAGRRKKGKKKHDLTGRLEVLWLNCAAVPIPTVFRVAMSFVPPPSCRSLPLV